MDLAKCIFQCCMMSCPWHTAGPILRLCKMDIWVLGFVEKYAIKFLSLSPAHSFKNKLVVCNS